MNSLEILKEYAPFLYQCYIKGEVYMFDGNGYCRELKEYQKAKIQELNEKVHDSKVIAVISGKYKMSDGDMLEMDSYILFSEKDNIEIYDDDTLIIFSYVENLSWGDGDFGDIGIREVSGLLFRKF